MISGSVSTSKAAVNNNNDNNNNNIYLVQVQVPSNKEVVLNNKTPILNLNLISTRV